MITEKNIEVGALLIAIIFIFLLGVVITKRYSNEANAINEVKSYYNPAKNRAPRLEKHVSSTLVLTKIKRSLKRQNL